MGQENSVRKKPVTNQPIESTILSGSTWESYAQTKSELTNKPETVFSHNFNSSQTWQETRNYINYIQTIRHPNIIKYTGSNYVHNERLELRTSPVVSLVQFIPQCSKQHLMQGLREIATAVNFLHTSVKACHIGLSIGEVFINTFNGCWMLGGFGLTRKLGPTIINELLLMEKFSLLKVELNENEIELTDAASIDVWLYKQFVNDVIEATNFHSPLEELLDWLETNWFELSFDGVLGHDVLNSIATETVETLTNISLLDHQAKLLFVESLPSRLPKLDECVLAFRIAPLIFTSHLYTEAFVRLNVIPYLLIPKSKKFAKELSKYQLFAQNALISEGTFKLFIIPLLMRLFAKKELHLRLTLLKFFKYYIYLFSYQQQTQIHSEVLLGLRDSREELAKLTFFALGELTSYMGVRGVTGKEATVLFTDTRPRDYQLPITLDKVDEKSNINTEPIEETQQNGFNIQISTENDSMDFFQNETKPEPAMEYFNTNTVNETNLFSEIKKPRLYLGHTQNSFTESELTDTELALETEDVIKFHKPTLLELSQINTNPKSELVDTDDTTDLDSPIMQAENAWEDWDPF